MIIFFINQYWSSEKRLLNVIINKLFIHAFVLSVRHQYRFCMQSGFHVKEIYNSYMTGLSLPGSVEKYPVIRFRLDWISML